MSTLLGVDVHLTAQYNDGQVWLRLNGVIVTNVTASSTPDAGPGSVDEVVLETVSELLQTLAVVAQERRYPNGRPGSGHC